MSDRSPKVLPRLLGTVRKLKKENHKLVLNLMDLRAEVEELRQMVENDHKSGVAVIAYSQ